MKSKEETLKNFVPIAQQAGQAAVPGRLSQFGILCHFL
jgi:hypothetical protein